MSDNADLADEIVNNSMAVGVAKIQQKLEPSGVVECEDCLQDIPLNRREAMPSCTRCIDCQEILDQKMRTST